MFGSCRVALPHEPPYTLSKDDDPRGREHDALRTLALEMISGERRWPDLLLMLGDQVYVDEGSPRVREWIRSRRDVREPPGEEVADFEEYTRLYRESWGEPVMRWLLSVVPTSMVIDDHDMHDDWLISREWIEEMRRQPWWEEREIGGLMSYWVYQHLGNLSPRELEENPEYREAREAEDSAPVLRRFARHEGRVPEGKRWSFCTDIDRVRVVVADDRTGRVLEDGRRSIVDDEEWEWIVDHATGDFDHLLIGTTDPFLLGPGLHYIEAWNEAVCDGAWGEGPARLGERMRRALDFDHWAAFQSSFHRFAKLLEDVGSGRRGRAARDDRRPVGRRAPRVPGRRRVPARRRGVKPRLPGGVLAVPQRARRARATRGPVRDDADGTDAWRVPRPRGGRRRSGDPLARHRGAVLR